MMKKRVLAMLLCAAMVFSVCACGDSNAENKNTENIYLHVSSSYAVVKSSLIPTRYPVIEQLTDSYGNLLYSKSVIKF